MYTYHALVTNVVDGDTMDMLVDVGFSIGIHHRFRVANYDAPESWRPKTEAERIKGEAAKFKAIQLLLNTQVIVKTYKLDIYARYSADITMSDGTDYATYMINNGYIKI